MENRAIVHLDLDTFFVSCERLVNPQLNDKPVLIGGTSDRGVVASCSYEARKFGIHSAMPMKMARILCPQAVVIRGDSGLYSKFSQMVTDIIKEQSPLYEKSSMDEFYIDISGMDRFFGCFQWATELRRTIIKETRLPLSLGLSINKTVSKVGTGEAKPNGYLQIGSGMEKQFLAPLSIKKIPMVGDKTYQLLRGLGLYHVKTVQGMPIELMQAAMGVNGISLWKKCQGIDNSPVVPYQERKSISIERTFEQDTID
ncbi:MAG: DNA polymerase IV, partial [Bacteroidetes bacterium]|nr:DNA polymerase IV [Bacteroidota bacterium]